MPLYSLVAAHLELRLAVGPSAAAQLPTDTHILLQPAQACADHARTYRDRPQQPQQITLGMILRAQYQDPESWAANKGERYRYA